MAPRLDDDKRFPQNLLGIERQNALQLSMHSPDVGWKNAEINDSLSNSLDENQAAEIPITSEKNAPFLLGGSNQCEIVGFG